MLKKVTPLVLALCVASGLQAAPPEPKTEDEKSIYALGLAIASNLGQFHLTEAEVELVKAGLADGLLNHPKKVELATYGPKLGELAQRRSAAANAPIAAAEKKAGQAYADKAIKEKGAVKKPSGLIYMELKPGTGASPKATDKVKVHYKGTLIDGTVFDSSIERGQPVEFPLNAVIKCWTEGVQLMKVGGKSKLVCPSDIAYGDNPKGDKIKPGSTLVFEVELLNIVK